MKPERDRERLVHHPKASELAPASDLRPRRSEPAADRKPLSRGERRVTRTVLAFLLGALVLALVVWAFLVDRPELWIVAVIAFVPYVLLFLGPVIMAETTKEAQDEAVREERGGER
jgi:hypothetical protein